MSAVGVLGILLLVVGEILYSTSLRFLFARPANKRTQRRKVVNAC